jgi:hypothetical protein
MFGRQMKASRVDLMGRLILLGVGIAIGIALWPFVLPLLLIALIISAIRQSSDKGKKQHGS